MSSELIVGRHGAVLHLTINRPEKRNALALALLDEIGATLTSHASDPGILCAVITGAGDKCFAAGGDLQELDAIRSAADTRAMSRRGRAALDQVRAFPVPVIATLNGPALGGGAELALACDLRIAAEHASFGLPEVTRGIVPGAGGTQRLPRLVGPERALDLILTGRRIDAAEALRIGLVSRVVPPAELLAQARALAGAIADNAPLAVRAARAAVWRGLDLALEEGLRLEQLLAEPVRQSEDAQEGPRAFLEKRKPEWKGR